MKHAPCEVREANDSAATRFVICRGAKANAKKRGKVDYNSLGRGGRVTP